MKTFKGEGLALDLTAPSGGVVSGRGVLIGSIFVIAAITAAEGEAFVGRRLGVFEHTAATHASNQAWAVGDPLYWDDSAKKLTKTATGGTIVAVAVAAKVSTVAVGKAVLVPRMAAAAAAIADSGGGDDLAALKTKFNTLLAAARAGGLITT